MIEPMVAIVIALFAAAAIVAHTATLAAFGLIGAGLLIAYPAVSLILLVAISQEITTPASGRAASLFTFGHQVYFSTIARSPLIFWACLLAAFGAGLKCLASGYRPLNSNSGKVPILLGVLPLVAVGLAVAAHSSVTSAIGQDGRPFLILLFAWFAAATIDVQPGGRSVFRKAAVVGLVVAAALGIADLYFRHGGSLAANANPYNVNAVTTNRLLLFYDTALPAFAGAVLIALLLKGIRRRLWLGVLLSFIVVCSFRRSVWVALIGVVGVLFVVSKQRIRAAARVLLAVVPLVVLLHFADPSLSQAASSKLSSAVAAIQGRASSNDVSTTGHLNDIVEGWKYATEKPIRGWGPDVGQLPNLFNPVVQGDRLYVHDEYLMDWIRFGLLGLSVILVLLAILVRLSVRLLRRPDGHPVEELAGAIFLIIFPVCAVTAPFLTTTGRWPALVGLAAGLVGAGVGARGDGRLGVIAHRGANPVQNGLVMPELNR